MPTPPSTPPGTATGSPPLRSSDLRPFIATLGADIEAAARPVLGVGPEVELRWRPGSAGVGLDVDLPNGVQLALTLAPSDPAVPGWIRGAGAQLSYLSRGGQDPMDDPQAAPSLRALGRLFRAAQGVDAAPLWAAAERVAAFAEVDDTMYRQVSHGPHGTYATLRLGFKCSQDCWFCWQGRGWPDAPDEFYEGWLHELEAAGVREISFSGGEPTLHPRLPELLAAAKGYGMRTLLQTNAIRLRRPAYLESLRSAGLDVAFVSFHSADPGVSDAMTRARGTWKSTVAGIEACLAAGVSVALNCVVERANVEGLPAHADFVAERFVRAFPRNPPRSVQYSHPTRYYDAGTHEQSIVPLDEVRGPLARAAGRLADAGVFVELIGSCGFPPCVVADRPDLIRLLDPGEAALMDERDTAGRGHPEACQPCAARARCLGPRGDYVRRFGSRGLVPFEVLPQAGAFSGAAEYGPVEG